MRPPTSVAVFLAGLLLGPAAAAAQRDTELHLGRWGAGDGAASYEFRSSGPLSGRVTHGFAATVVIDDRLGRRQAFYGFGWELQAYRPRAGLAPYGLAGVSLGLVTDTTSHHLGAHWSIGGGVEWRPFSVFALGLEARYRATDRGPRGFWRTRDARSGFSIAAGLAVRLGGRRSSAPPPASPATPPGSSRPSSPALPPASDRIVGNAADVVRTALAAIGTPYQWGGTAANGFDCSGLIQYAYGRYGIRLPRMSRDQARAGVEVPPAAEALVAGDILLFSARPGGGVTHVGMYVGEGKFIHSSSTGVRISLLDVHDAEGSYWLPRWVGARRVIP